MTDHRLPLLIGSLFLIVCLCGICYETGKSKGIAMTTSICIQQLQRLRGESR